MYFGWFWLVGFDMAILFNNGLFLDRSPLSSDASEPLLLFAVSMPRSLKQSLAAAFFAVEPDTLFLMLPYLGTFSVEQERGIHSLPCTIFVLDLN